MEADRLRVEADRLRVEAGRLNNQVLIWVPKIYPEACCYVSNRDVQDPTWERTFEGEIHHRTGDQAGPGVGGVGLGGVDPNGVGLEGLDSEGLDSVGLGVGLAAGAGPCGDDAPEGEAGPGGDDALAGEAGPSGDDALVGEAGMEVTAEVADHGGDDALEGDDDQEAVPVTAGGLGREDLAAEDLAAEGLAAANLVAEGKDTRTDRGLSKDDHGHISPDTDQTYSACSGSRKTPGASAVGASWCDHEIEA